jgi:hypothetical protein
MTVILYPGKVNKILQDNLFIKPFNGRKHNSCAIKKICKRYYFQKSIEDVAISLRVTVRVNRCKVHKSFLPVCTEFSTISVV